MRVFITGGGHVGRAVVRRFLDNHWHVAILAHPQEMDSLPFSASNRAGGTSERITIFEGDLNTFSSENIPEDAVIVHLAAKVHTVPKSEEEIQDFFHVNRDGTIRLADLALQRKAKAFLFVSTSGVYGEKLYEGLCSEEGELAPNSPYTQSKFEAERYLQEFWPKNTLIIFRPSVMFGPGDRGNFSKLFQMAKRGFVPMIQGKSRKKISFTSTIWLPSWNLPPATSTGFVKSCTMSLTCDLIRSGTWCKGSPKSRDGRFARFPCRGGCFFRPPSFVILRHRSSGASCRCPAENL